MNLIIILTLSGLVAALVSLVTTPIIIKLAPRLGIIDDPRKNKHPKVIHTVPLPRGGGIPVLIAIVLSSLIFLTVDKHLAGILIGCILVGLVGFLDDKYNLNPYTRLFLGFVAASFPIIAGIGIAFISNPLGGTIDLSHPQLSFYLLGKVRTLWVISDLFALFFIVFMMNMLNMGAKGVDGQLPGVVVIAALTTMVLSLRFSSDPVQIPVIILAAITAGAYLGFLPWNFYPQKILPGYGASSLAGYILAILSILATAKVGTLLVVLGIPLVDTGYTVIRRILSGKSPVWGDRGHLHHRLLDAGMSKKQVTIFYWVLTAILGILAVNLNTITKLSTIVGVVVFVGGLILFLTQRKSQKV